RRRDTTKLVRGAPRLRVAEVEKRDQAVERSDREERAQQCDRVSAQVRHVIAAEWARPPVLCARVSLLRLRYRHVRQGGDTSRVSKGDGWWVEVGLVVVSAVREA